MSFHLDEEEEEERDLGIKLDREHLLRLWGFIRPHIRLFIYAFFVLMILFALDLAGPYIVRRVIDGPVESARSTGALDFAQLLPYLLAYPAIMLGVLLATLAHMLLTSLAGQRVVCDLRVQLYSHILHLSPEYFDRVKTGRLVTRIGSDCENLSELFTTGVVSTLADLLKVMGLFVVMFIVSPALTIVVLLASPVLIVGTLVFQKKARNAYRSVRGNISKQTGWFAEAIQGLQVTRLFGQEKRIDARYQELNKRSRRGWILTITLFTLYFSIIDLGSNGTQAALLYQGGINIGERGLSYGAFIQFWIYFGMILSPIRSLGEKYNIIQSALASAERIFHILDEVPALPEKKDAILPLRGPQTISFENVNFSYPEGLPVLKNLSFEIPQGSHVAVVGPTGAGKTTLIQLLSRFRDPSSGRILVGGKDLRDLDLRAHRRRIGIVLQDVFLFASNILENIRLWDDSIPLERVARAIEAVQAGDLVERAGGIEAIVEERGATLSQGERQLLAFARALVHDPDILILDEATASIDSQTELKIQEAMQVLMEGRTTLVIAHRLSTIRDADNILVLDHGELVESGRHEELLQQGGLYARLIHALEEMGPQAPANSS